MEQSKQRSRFRVPTCCLVFIVLAAVMATGVVFFISGGKIRVNGLLDGVKAKGEPVRSADLEAPDVPDADNAFLYYERASAMLVPAPQSVIDAGSRMHDRPMDSWSKADIDLLRSYVKQNAAAMAIVHQGSLCKGYKSRVVWKDSITALFPHMAKSRELARQLSYKARVDLYDGNVDEAVDTCGDALRLSSHVASEPVLIGLLVGVGCRSITYASLEQAIGVANDERTLRHIMSMLGSAPRLEMRRAMMGERANGVTIFENLRKGKYSMADLMGQTGNSTGSRIRPPGWLFYYDEAAYISIMNDQIELADKPYYSIQKQISELDVRTSKIPVYMPIARILTPVYARAYAHGSQTNMKAEVLRLAAAIKLYRLKHGQYPKALADLSPEIIKKVPLDEFTGKSLIYRLKGGGFVVYSVGTNQVDDGGTKPDSKKPGGGDIVYEEK